MSYILDALKKSEQERGQGSVPNVQTMHTSSLNYNNKKAYWPYILIIAIALNLIAIVFVYLQKDQASPGESINNADRHIDHNTVLSNKDNSHRSAPQTAIAPDKETLQATGQTKHYPATNATEAATAELITAPHKTNADDSPVTTTHQSTPKRNDEVITYHDLPDAIKQQLPTITISAHVYSSKPSLRSIVINNNFLEEGEYILDGLILQEITTGGAIMLYQGTRFHYDVISGWQ